MYIGGGDLGKAAIAAVVASLLTFGGMAYSPVLAADNTAGTGKGVAIGNGSSAPKDENVAIGKGAEISYSNGASNATGDIVVGNGANINNYASQGGSIAIGKNAKIENMAGGGEASFAFGQTTYSGGWWSSSRIPADPTKVIGSIAIGDNTFARTGSTMIGSHNYKGDLGDTTVDSASTRTDALNVYATTIGANSFSNGAFTTSTGVYNIISSEYNGGRAANPVKNLGATINGALNSIESKTADSYYSGIANTVSGIANRTFNANGSLIYGAGNEITNSFTDLSGVPEDSGASAKEFAEKLRTTIKESESGGSALAIGGGNTIDRSIRSQVMGVNNTLTGNSYYSEYSSQYNMIDGYNNTASNVNHAYVIGANNTIQGKKFSDATKDGVLSKEDCDKAKKDDNLIVIGDNHTLAKDVSNNIILGTTDADKKITTSVSNIVMIGHNADAQKEGGVALGADSVASGDRNVVGYDPSRIDHNEDTTGVWKSKAAAVSVGDSSKNLTRQITNVAAGK
ncbi:S-layer protein [Megasphaera elsdenii]|uniref:S-layer protein n=1 Tax=Megasphaera elsdenii TaxID=907 RepID=UPI003F5466C7